MAERFVIRKSTGEKLRIMLAPQGVAKQRTLVSIDFPGTEVRLEERRHVGFNVRLTFEKGERGKMVVVNREPIDPGQESFRGVLIDLYDEMAMWAGSILNSRRGRRC